ncbi:hypothetical protein KP509_37G025900 [Ceratopteris richardii]|uniref:Uncharacterized protein n=1 Tax=Ceratopteris richardii TaxID=49495 RepID=A0A8T2Q7I5_CERRI|nr:hypothetical protein KP509_37G025900 [Ceratopteris richardii]
MHTASLIRAALSTARRHSIRRFANVYSYGASSFLSRSQERLIHSTFKSLSLSVFWEREGQHSIRYDGHAKSQKHWASTAATAAPLSGAIPKSKYQQPVIYRGPRSDIVRKIKLLSLTSLFLSATTGPVLAYYTSPHLPMIFKAGVASAVILLSASITGILHWFAGPYVHKMIWMPGSKELNIEMITWLAKYEKQTVAVEDIRPPKTRRPFVSFAAKDKFYFVDAANIQNKDFLRLVTFSQKK